MEENFDLRLFNTFGVAAKAKLFVAVRSEKELIKLIQSAAYKQNHALVLGGGSNILFTKDFEGLVIKNDLMGMDVLSESDAKITLRVSAGENWHGLVVHCMKNNWGGIENLSLIPGSVGAAPMQNIGAYGVEVRQVIEKVDAIERQSGAKRTFTFDECRFGYRESIFKQDLKEKYFISSVTLTLTKKNHVLNTSYGTLQETLKQLQVEQPTIQSISQAVIHIRQSKLPDPGLIGNAGSFFKNPAISIHQYEKIKKEYVSIPGYFSENQQVKVPAGWLIEQCGWKGKRFNDVGVHQHQALVLVNYGNGKGSEIFDLATRIQASVIEKFGIDLTTEVNII